MRRFQGPPRAKALNHKPTPHVNSLPAELIDGKVMAFIFLLATTAVVLTNLVESGVFRLAVARTTFFRTGGMSISAPSMV
jgi:hypothetical protein